MTAVDYRPLITDLEKKLEELNPSDIPLFLGELERLKVLVSIRIMNDRNLTKDMINADPSDAPLLTIPEAAKRLAITNGRAYELSRQGRLPIVKIGKYVRVDPKELGAWIEQKKGLANELYSAYSPTQRDRGRTKTSSKAARVNPSSSCRQVGSSPEYSGPMGKRRASHQKADRTTDPTALSVPKAN